MVWILKLETKVNSVVKNISISNGFNSVYLDSIEVNSSKELFLDFKKNNPKYDGNFGIAYEINDKKYLQRFGYYSNGLPSNEFYSISIYNDTINISR